MNTCGDERGVPDDTPDSHLGLMGWPWGRGGGPQGPGAPDTYYLLGPGLGLERVSHLLESREMKALRLGEIEEHAQDPGAGQARAAIFGLGLSAYGPMGSGQAERQERVGYGGGRSGDVQR